MMKTRLAGAQKGHNLLKRKVEALQFRFRMILGKIIEVRWKFAQRHSSLIKAFVDENFDGRCDEVSCVLARRS
jgi:vacuolar-type H+-ATPase subunit D/Vma8